ncbi:hypothetical protein IHV09_15175 [Fictibacillus sp. 23RED33]|uniref:hypothetical protein n=1 Tax=Fictibacillus sp. 23RED33 TaxID=2745879 RepID=UPI0018CCB8BD|nr:hypothetical protein [Fictibacillus sp. 23RED33]MBH0174909.1 hypothetical protein [Fictibacillus sp. 23RED33]
MEVNGKNGKYTTRLSQAGKETTIHLTVFLSFFLIICLYFVIRNLKEDPVVSFVMLVPVVILTALIVFIIKETKSQTSIVSDSELTDTGYVTTFIDTNTLKSLKVEILYSDMEKCLLSPHSIIRPSAIESFETIYNKHITFNILFRTGKGKLEVMKFTHHDEEEIHLWLRTLRENEIPLEITDYDLRYVSQKDYLSVVMDEVDRRPYFYRYSIEDLNVGVTREKPNDYTLPETKEKLASNKLVKFRIPKVAIYSVQFLAMTLFIYFLHNEYTSDEMLTLTSRIYFYTGFILFFSIYIYMISHINIKHCIQYAFVTIFSWIVATYTVDGLISKVSEKFTLALSFEIFFFSFLSPVLIFLPVILRELKPAIYHEKHRKDIEKMNESEEQDTLTP